MDYGESVCLALPFFEDTDNKINSGNPGVMREVKADREQGGEKKLEGC